MSFRPCTICISPFREKIENLIDQGITPSEVSRKYHNEFKILHKSFYIKLRKHIAKKHPPIISKYNTVNESITENGTFENYANRLLEKGFQTIQKGDKVSHASIIAAQKVLLDQAKVKLTSQQENFDKIILNFLRGRKVEIGQYDNLNGN